METIAEQGGVIPHHHRPMPGSNYFPQKDASSYFFPNGPNPQSSIYHGYKQGEKGGSRGPPMYDQIKGLDRRGGGGDLEDLKGRGGGMSITHGPGGSQGGGDGERYYAPTSQSSHIMQQQQHSMIPYQRQRGMSQFLSPHRLDNGKMIGNNPMDSNNVKYDHQSITPEKMSEKDNRMNEFTPKKTNHSFENAMMSSPYYYNSKHGRQPGFMNEKRLQHFDSNAYPDRMRDSVKDLVFDSMTHGRGKDDGSKSEAIPVPYDETEMQSQANDQHFREKLERSISQDAVAARGNAINSHKYLYESGDHRPRAITMNSMYNRRDGPSIQTHPYANNKNHELYNRMREHYNQSGMNNPYYYRDKEKEAIPPMSPSAYMGKHQRRLSGGEIRAPTRQDSMNRMMMHPEKCNQSELLPFSPMAQSKSQQLQAQTLSSEEDQQDQSSVRKSLDSNHDKTSPMKSPICTDSISPGVPATFGSGSRKSPMASPSEDVKSKFDVGEHGSPSHWCPSGVSSGLSPKLSAKPRSLSEERMSPKSDFPEKVHSQESTTESSSPKEDENQQSYLSDDRKEFSSPSKLRSSSPPSPKGSSPLVTPSRKHSADSSDDNSLPDALPRELMPKKEILSDEGEDDSFHSSGNYPGMSPQSPNSSPGGANYRHFQQPFFQSHEALSHPFGSPRGMQDDGPGMPPAFPFNKEMSGRFHMSGLARDMPMGPTGPFMGQMPMNMGLDKDVYFCHLCSYSGKSKSDFDNHMSIHFEYNCPHCDYTSRTEGRLKRHIKDFHTDENGRRSMPGRPKVFKCKQCSFSATEKDKFWEHARSHIKEDKLLQCPKCPFVTEYKHHLEYHLRNHFGSKPFKCNKCNYSCVNKSMLNSHMKSHTNVYQYRCSDCTYATKYCHSLKLHLRKYSHKPATVLNQDGSLPQGIDADSSGLSVNTKRGPPRGPRGPRKEKNDPFFNHQMFGMPPMPPMGVPPGMNPMLKGMMPFWPVMPPSGIHPGHPGIVPGLPNMPQHMGGRGENHMDIRERRAMDGRSDHEMNGIMGGDSPVKDDEAMYLPCRLCDFIGDSTEALCLHLLQVHKDETGEMASMYGINENTLAESMERAKKTKIERMDHQMERRMSEMSNESENEMSDYRRRNTIAGLLSRDGSSFHRGNNSEKPFWSSFSQGDKTGVEGRIQDLCYMDEGNDDDDQDQEPSSRMDILQQMTLKFGGTLPNKQSTSLDKEMNRNVDEEGKTDNTNENKSDGEKKLGHKESPLDLTKPKSDSPPMFSNPSSPRRVDELNSEEDDVRPLWMESGRGSELDKVTEHLARKRQISEMEENLSSTPGNANQAVPEPSNIVPRKRSRKGKAYKLETLCLKLQERRSKSPFDSDDADSDNDRMGSNLPLPQTFTKNEEESEEKDKSVHGDWDKQDDNDLSHSGMELKEDTAATDTDEVEKDQTSKDDEDKDLEKNVKDHEEVNGDGESNAGQDGGDESIGKEIESVDDKEKELKKSENGDEIKVEIKEEVDKEDSMDKKDDSFEKFQEALEDLESEMNANVKQEVDDDYEKKMPEPSAAELSNSLDDDKANKGSSNDCDDDDDDDDAKTEILDDNHSTDLLDLSDKEISSDGFGNENPSEKPSDEVEIEEKVDLINTVIENRKKPLPPAVRRGTELAWKLLNDPVNPVTSIPIPAVSPPTPEWKSQQPKSPLSVPPGNMMSPLRNGMRMGPVLNSGQPQAPPVPAMPGMKHFPIPLPPTPMAFIPPTNRMIPEHMMPRPPPVLSGPVPRPGLMSKPVPKDMYECTYCDLSFRDCVMYTVHMGYHSNRNPFKCNSCGIICRDKVEFFLHIARSPHS